MKVRDILEVICRNGDNVWQTGMLGLRSASIIPLLEAWTQQSKQQIVSKNADKGITLIDHVVLDDYDLSLWRVPVVTDFKPSGVLYAVAINSEQHGPTEEAPQRIHFPGSSLRHLPVTSVAKVLRNWIETHGKLAIGTVERSKLNAYRRILRDFKITDMSSEDPNYGFFIQ